MKLGFKQNMIIERKASSSRSCTATALFSVFLAFGLEGIARAKAPQLPVFSDQCYIKREWKVFRKSGTVTHRYPKRWTFDEADRRIIFRRANGRLERRKLDFTVCEDKPRPKSPECLAAEAEAARAREEHERNRSEDEETNFRASGQVMSKDIRASMICSDDDTRCNPETGEQNIADLIKGKVAVLFFTQSACRPCEWIFPYVLGLYERFKVSPDFMMVAIVSGGYGHNYRVRNIVELKAKDLGKTVDFPVFKEDRDPGPDYIKGYPIVIITNKKGEVVAAFKGGNVNFGCREITELVERLLAEPAQ